MYRLRAPRVTRTGTNGTARKSTTKRVQRVTTDLHRSTVTDRRCQSTMIDDVQGHITDRRCARSHSNTPSVKKPAPLNTRFSSLRCVSAAEHHTAEHYSKMGRAKPRKHHPRSDLLWNTCKDFLKIPSL